jgi:hypothetical protein
MPAPLKLVDFKLWFHHQDVRAVMAIDSCSHGLAMRRFQWPQEIDPETQMSLYGIASQLCSFHLEPIPKTLGETSCSSCFMFSAQILTLPLLMLGQLQPENHPTNEENVASSLADLGN